MKKLTYILAIGILATQASYAAIISLYQFDESTVDSVRGNGFDAALLSGTSAYTAGISGKAYNFDGSTILKAPIAGDGLSSFSFSSWVNFRQSTNYGTILKNWGESQVGAFHLGLGGDGSLFQSLVGGYEEENPIGGPYSIADGPAVSLLDWHHVGVTIGQSFQKLYINGGLVATGIAPFALSSRFPFMSFGGKLNDAQDGVAASAPGWLNGYLDDVAFLDEELTPEQIFSVYQAGLTGDSIEQVFSPVPEPGSTLALAGLLLGGMSLRRRK